MEKEKLILEGEGEIVGAKSWKVGRRASIAGWEVNGVPNMSTSPIETEGQTGWWAGFVIWRGSQLIVSIFTRS